MQTVYYADYSAQTICSMLEDGSNKQTILSFTDKYPLGLAVDGGNGVMFWSDYDNQDVYSCNLDGSNLRMIVDNDTYFPSSIALDVDNEKLYYTDDVQYINRCNYDGSGLERFYDCGADTGPSGLVIDCENDRMFYSHYNSDGKVMAGDFNGVSLTNVGTVLSSGSLYSRELTIDTTSGYIFGVDDASGGLKRASLIDGSGFTTLLSDPVYGACVWISESNRLVYSSQSNSTIASCDQNGLNGQTLVTGIDYVPSIIVAQYGSEPVLPVTLSSFTGCLCLSTPLLQWTTQSESENAGWNVYRSSTDQYDDSIQLTVDLIPGAGTTSQATDYIWEDTQQPSVGAEYWYWLESVSYSGATETFGPVTLTIPYEEPGQNNPEVPRVYGLMQNHPNPFNPSTEISFVLPQSAHCTIDVYDIAGRRIKTLLNEPVAGEEPKSVIWQGDDAQGNPVASGIYYYKMYAGKYTSTKKMILMK
jgi:hypothetical protein